MGLLALPQLLPVEGAGPASAYKLVFPSQPWAGSAACENPCSLIPTPDKDDNELVYPPSAHKPPGARPPRASPLPLLK